MPQTSADFITYEWMTLLILIYICRIYNVWVGAFCIVINLKDLYISQILKSAVLLPVNPYFYTFIVCIFLINHPDLNQQSLIDW